MLGFWSIYFSRTRKAESEISYGPAERESHDNVITLREKKNIQKKRITRKKAKHDNLDDNQKEQLRQYEKKMKKVMHVNFDEEKKEFMKKGDNKRKNEKSDNLDENEKEQLRKFEKKGKSHVW